MKILVQKFGGTSVATSENRELSVAKIIQAREDGFSPVVVVSAIGRKGAPYATDTLIDELRSVDPATKPDMREYDMIVSVGEIISTAVMAQLLRSKGYPARSMTGYQAGIVTDDRHGDSRIQYINPEYKIGRAHV